MLMRRPLAWVVALVVLGAPSMPRAGAAAAGVNPAVFQLLTLSKADDTVVYGGTAFFVTPDGAALTNSHVVYVARTRPADYQLIALFRGEYYSAAVVCASALTAPPSPDGTLRDAPGRDVAEIRVAPSRVAGAKVIEFPDGPQFSAHLTRLPAFPTLRLGTDPRPGMPVRVTGYGVIEERLHVTPWEQWTTAGVISAVARADDGTPLFRVTSLNAPRPGNSGSPVLDGSGQVVGILTWASANDLSFSAGIAVSALKSPCPQ
jgi:S1-C subfamily serine protease